MEATREKRDMKIVDLKRPMYGVSQFDSGRKLVSVERIVFGEWAGPSVNLDRDVLPVKVYRPLPPAPVAKLLRTRTFGCLSAALTIETRRKKAEFAHIDGHYGCQVGKAVKVLGKSLNPTIYRDTNIGDNEARKKQFISAEFSVIDPMFGTPIYTVADIVPQEEVETLRENVELVKRASQRWLVRLQRIVVVPDNVFTEIGMNLLEVQPWLAGMGGCMHTLDFASLCELSSDRIDARIEKGEAEMWMVMVLNEITGDYFLCNPSGHARCCNVGFPVSDEDFVGG